MVFAVVLLGCGLAYHLARRSRRAGTSSTTPKLMQNNPDVLLQEANRLSWILNWPAAGPLYQRAEELFTTRGDSRNALYAKIGVMRSRAESMSFVDLSEFLGHQLSNPIMKQHPRLRLWCLASKGYTDIEINDDAAEDDWQKARVVARQLGESAWANRASGELGLIAFLHGNILRAARMVGGALLWAMAYHDVGAEIRYLELLGEGVEGMNRHNEALMFSNHAIKVAKATPDCGFPFMAYETNAAALAGMGRPGEARAALTEALDQAKRHNRKGHEAEVLMQMGRLAANEHELPEATHDLEAAGRTAVSQNFYRLAGDTMFDLADIYRREGNLDKAEARLQVGLEASEHVGDGYTLPRDLEAMAEVNALDGHPGRAEILYQRGEDVIDGMLVETPGAYAESSLLNVMSSIYVSHFKFCVARENVQEAFETLERARGRTVADFLQNKAKWNETWRGTDVPGDQIAVLQNQLLRASAPPERQQILNDLFEAEERRAYGDDARLRGAVQAASRPAPVETLERILGPNELFLEYVLAEPESFCLVVNHSDARIVELGAGRKEVEVLSSRFVAGLKSQKGAQTEGRQLYQLLLKPIPGIDTEHLIIVPDGELHALPFGALIGPDGRYILESHVVSYAPSATVLEYVTSRHGLTQPPLTFLGVGGVTYQQAHSRSAPLGFLYRGLDDLRGVDLADLPASRDEVVEANRALGGDGVLLLGSKATERAFEAEPLSEFRIVHVAVHAFANTRLPEESGLIFARGARSSDSRILHTHDIVQLPLHADLVTLSACDTGKGRLEGEEGIESLMQSFLVAGARSVIGSLWKADDAATAELMENFYIRLAQGEGVASALRDAKLSVLNKFGPHAVPFYWAGFVLAGNGDQRIPLR
jgi:CHAT domain-containing protein/tetratricopeptide (TPR) repeat protein